MHRIILLYGAINVARPMNVEDFRGLKLGKNFEEKANTKILEDCGNFFNPI